MNTTTTTMRRYVINEPMLIAHDKPLWPSENSLRASASVLEKYYTDIYRFFLAKLADFDRADTVSETDSGMLKDLLQEIIKVKTLLERGV